MWPITRCSGGGGLSCRPPPECGGRLTSAGWTGYYRGPKVKTVGSETAARNTTKTIAEKEETP